MAYTRRQKWLLAATICLTSAGLVITFGSIYSLTIADQLAEQNQIAAVEVVPLVESKPEEKGSDVAIGDVFAKMFAPRLGGNYVRNIAEGTSVEKVLNLVGIGHYLTSQMPGEVGNFALAAHRNGNGGPFRNIDKFVAGDEIVIETSSTKYIYRYLDTKVVEPGDLDVISKNPSELKNKVVSGKYLTLTTCTPIYVNTQRLVVWFGLVDEEQK